MNVPALLEQHHDNFFFNTANLWEERSLAHNENQEYAKAWCWSTLSRLPYLVDVIVSAVVIPLALIGILFGIVEAIVTWGRETPFLDYCGNKLVEKVNHLFLSTIGAIFSPWLANKCKDMYQLDSDRARFR